MESNSQERIETLMKGQKSFTIFLKKSVPRNFVGAAAQSSSPAEKFEVIPQVDEIHFSVEKEETKVYYKRNYSDWPPSTSDFALSQIEKVEEEMTA